MRCSQPLSTYLTELRLASRAFHTAPWSDVFAMLTRGDRFLTAPFPGFSNQLPRHLPHLKYSPSPLAHLGLPQSLRDSALPLGSFFLRRLASGVRGHFLLASTLWLQPTSLCPYLTFLFSHHLPLASNYYRQSTQSIGSIGPSYNQLLPPSNEPYLRGFGC